MIPLIIAGVMIAASLMGSKKEDDQAKVANITEKSNTRVRNILRMADNEMQAARDNLARYQQSQSNKFKLMSGGDQLNAQATNILRLADESVRGGLERRISAAEEYGSMAAGAGAAGVGGGSLTMVEQASRMRVERVEQMHSVLQDQQASDAQSSMEQTQRAIILGLDDTQFQTSMSFIEDQAREVPRVNWAAAGLKAVASGMSAYSSMGGSFGGSAPANTGLQQSVAGPGVQQSAAVNTSPFGARPQPTLRMK